VFIAKICVQNSGNRSTCRVGSVGLNSWPTHKSRFRFLTFEIYRSGLSEIWPLLDLNDIDPLFISTHIFGDANLYNIAHSAAIAPIEITYATNSLSTVFFICDTSAQRCASLAGRKEARWI